MNTTTLTRPAAQTEAPALTTITVTLPRRQALAWLAGYDGTDATRIASSIHTMTLTLGASALEDLARA